MERRTCKPRWWRGLQETTPDLPAPRVCPQCRSTDISYIAERRLNGDGYLQCQGCNYSGPKAKSWTERIQRWNEEAQHVKAKSVRL